MNKNIKAQDGIAYRGNVNIQYKFDNKTHNITKHNVGLLPLFTSIVLSLGDRTVEAKSYMPRYIMAKNADDEPCLSSKLLFQDRKYYLTGTLVDGTLADTIRYTFVVPITSMVKGQQITKLQLVNDKDGVCAEIILSGSKTINTDIGANILIYWDLTFADGEIVESE